MNYYDTAEMLTALKSQPQTAWLQEANSQSLQSSLKQLDVAYNHFFNKCANFPRFKSRRDKQSFTVPQHFSLENGTIKIPKIGTMKAVTHRPIEGTAKHITVSKTKTGKYFAAIACEFKFAVKPKT